ncbi:MAG: class D sortase [Chloroflexota bacterium]
MRDKRRVEDLSIEELEQVLALRRREERMKRVERMKRNGRVIQAAAPQQAVTQPEPEPASLPVKQATTETPAEKKSVRPRITSSGVQFVDEDGVMQPVKPQRKPRTQRKEPAPVEGRAKKATKRVVNSLLLLVEVAAVIGLVYLGFELITGIRVLEDQTAEAQQEIEAVRAASVPTLAPTPVLALNQVVLPGGHKFVEGQTPTLNIDEIPENIRFAVADQILRPVIERPPATDETPLRLTVPKLNIDQTIVQGADWEALKQGVGYILNGVTPSSPTGTVALTAHNDIYGELFKNIDQLEPGDQFQVQTREDVFLYEITGTDIVAPTDVHVLNDVGKPQAILISCYPYRVNTQRIVVYADRVDT